PMAKAGILVVTWVDTTVAAGAIRITAMATAMVAATRTSAHGGIKPRMKCPPGSATKRQNAEGNTTGCKTTVDGDRATTRVPTTALRRTSTTGSVTIRLSMHPTLRFP